MPKPIPPALLRVFYVASYGEDIKKEEISYRVRPTDSTDEHPDANGCRTALDILVKGAVAETHYYNLSESETVEEFINEITEDVPGVLADTKEYIKLLAEAASAAGLLPN